MPNSPISRELGLTVSLLRFVGWLKFNGAFNTVQDYDILVN